MALTVNLRNAPRATVVTISGASEFAMFIRVSDKLAAACPGETLVIDLSATTLTRPEDIRQFLGQLRAGSPDVIVRVVCSRLSARRLLRRFAPKDTSCFGSVDEALADHALDATA